MLRLLRERPREGLLEIARRLGVARGTLQARLDRLTGSGVVTGYGPDMDVAALGHVVQAFTTFEVDQPAREAIAARLRAVPQILEAHVVTGPGDIWCRIAGTSNQHVQEVIDQVLEVPGCDAVRRSSPSAPSSPTASSPWSTRCPACPSHAWADSAVPRAPRALGTPAG